MGQTEHMELDTEACYRAVSSRDRRFDGVFYTSVHTTGIYCRPSCPARTPAMKNVSFHPSAAAAQLAGFRACKRCLPDATPGSPQWDVAADAAGRAMRLISDGVVDREGVPGLAQRLGYTPRHLTRLVTTELGAGPLALARARRAQTARTLIEATAMSFADIAFAAGFASVRQFNDTVQEVYAASPTQLRGGRGALGVATEFGVLTGRLEMRLAVRTPYDAGALLGFLGLRAVPGVESAGSDSYARSLSLPHGPATVHLRLEDAREAGETAFVTATYALHDLRDTSAAVERVRRLLDADCDPVAVLEVLGRDELLATAARNHPGLRVPGHVDGNEVAVRAVLGQQVSVAAARTAAHRLVLEHGQELPSQAAEHGVDRLFPEMATLAALDPETLPMPKARGRALVGLCAALADGRIDLSRGADRSEVREQLLSLPGIGPWTADYIAMRALGHPDVFLPTDIGVKHALARQGISPNQIVEVSERWRPWRSYALMHLWQSLTTSNSMKENNNVDPA